MAWAQRHRSVLTVLFMIAILLAAVAGIQHEEGQRRAEDQRQAEVGQAQAAAVTTKLCHVVNDQQAVIADVIDVVLASDNGTVSFSDIPGFSKMDEATRDYFLELERALSANPGGSLGDRLRDFAATRLVPAECT